MDPGSRRGDPTAVLLLAFAVVLGSVVPGTAQRIDCDGLRRRVAALDRGDGGHASSRFVRSARRQQAEIDRTLAYRRSLACDRRRFLVFGDAPPPECARIDARIERMNANMAALQEAAARGAESEPDERRSLVVQYEAYCREPGELAAGARGYPDRVYPPDGLPAPDAGFRRMPLEPGDDDPYARPDPREEEARPPETEQAGDAAAVGGAKAVCVKTCDGSFFPVSYSASSSNIASLEALCHANCPNAETRLFTYGLNGEISEAIDKEGKSYSEMPTANRFAKVHVATCGCRAPGKTWLETLTEADRLYAAGKHDVVVTQQMSDTLARAAPAVASKAPPRSRRPASTPLPPDTARAPAVAAAEDAAAKAAQAPGAGREPAGIDADDVGAGSLRGTGEAATPDAPAAEVPKRRVRVIAPNL